MDYDKLFYYRFDENVIVSITEIEIGTEYIIVKSRDTWCYLAFKIEQTDISGSKKYPGSDNIVDASIVNWEADFTTFPTWQTKGGE